MDKHVSLLSYAHTQQLTPTILTETLLLVGIRGMALVQRKEFIRKKFSKGGDCSAEEGALALARLHDILRTPVHAPESELAELAEWMITDNCRRSERLQKKKELRDKQACAHLLLKAGAGGEGAEQGGSAISASTSASVGLGRGQVARRVDSTTLAGVENTGNHEGSTTGTSAGTHGTRATAGPLMEVDQGTPTCHTPACALPPNEGGGGACGCAPNVQ
jgi:hypothetical protein